MEIKKKLTREEAITTYVTDPDAKVSTIAAAAGVSLQRFYQWLKAAGVKPNRKLGRHQKKSSLVSHDEMEWKPDEIKALRTHMGLSQGDLARELGVRQQTISEWETGVYRPRRSTAKYLAMVAERVGFAYQTESTEENDEP
jgi:DNA-binding transcriptional regulator YiaG